MTWLLFCQLVVLLLVGAVLATIVAYCAIEKWFEEKEL